MARYRVNAKFYVVLAGIVIVSIGIIALLTGRHGGELDMGTMLLELPVKAVVVRDETVTAVERYDRVHYLVNEGAAVSDGTPVAEVYKWGYSDEMTQSLLSVQQRILEAQLAALEGISNPDIDSVMLQIEQKRQAVRDCVIQGLDRDVLTLQNELAALLVQRGELLKGAVQPTEELNALYAEETEKTTQIDVWRSTVAAKNEGRISFYFDGYEKILNADKLDTINAALIASVLKGASATTADATEGQLFSVMDDEHWYIAFITEKNAPLRVVNGQRYTVVFKGYLDKPYSGVAMEPVLSDTGVLNMIEFSESLAELSGVRIAEATVKLEAEGIEAPVSALSVKDGMVSITTTGGAQDETVEVEVLAADEDRAIIRPKNGSGELFAGQRFVKAK